MNPVAFQVCLVSVILSSLISAYNLVLHLLYYSRPELQNHAIRIILLIPIFSTGTWLSIIDPDHEFVYESILDFWEALVVYSFFMLILTYAGGEHIWYQSSQVTHPDGLEHPFPFNYIFPPMALDPMFMRNCKRACLQFVLIKPFMVLIELGVIQAGWEHSFGWVFFNNLVYNITYSVALYALALLYMTMHHHPGLVGKRPIAKFFSVKTVIFFTFYQGFIIALIPNYKELNIDEIAIMVEMLIFSIPINFFGFNWHEFRTPNLPGNFASWVGRILINATNALSPWDLAVSASLNFQHRYEEHVLLEEPPEPSMIVQPVATPIGKTDNQA